MKLCVPPSSDAYPSQRHTPEKRAATLPTDGDGITSGVEVGVGVGPGETRTGTVAAGEDGALGAVEEPAEPEAGVPVDVVAAGRGVATLGVGDAGEAGRTEGNDGGDGEGAAPNVATSAASAKMRAARRRT